MSKPSPFPPLDLMLDHRKTVSHALAQSVRVGAQKKRSKAGGKAEPAAAQGEEVEWAPGERKVKAGLSPGQAADKIFPKPTTLQRAYRRFFIKHDLKNVRPHPTPVVLRPAGRRPRRRPIASTDSQLNYLSESEARMAGRGIGTGRCSRQLPPQAE